MGGRGGEGNPYVNYGSERLQSMISDMNQRIRSAEVRVNAFSEKAFQGDLFKRQRASSKAAANRLPKLRAQRDQLEDALKKVKRRRKKDIPF